MQNSTFIPRQWFAAAWALVYAVNVFAQTNSLVTNQFGFKGPEIFPIDPQIGQLRAADVDGDGLNDLVVVNNSRSKINILYNQTGKTNQVKKITAGPRDINELPADARFRIESIASEKRIASLALADLNSDKRPDIAYYGEPKELSLQYNGTNGWSAPKRWPIEDGQITPNGLVTGDLNGDGLTDLVLLAENHVYVLYQNTNHVLDEPEKIAFSGAVKSVQVIDVNADGRNDLILVNWESPTPFRFRLQNDKGELDPEIYFTVPPIRSYTAEHMVETNRDTVFVTIAQNSGRAQISRFTQKKSEPLAGQFEQGQFYVMPLSKTDKATRGMLWADVNSDGRADLLVAEPESGQLSLLLQKADGSLESAKKFSTLTGISSMSVADWDGDGKAEVFLLSADERQIGVTRLDEKQRLPFPTLIPIDGKPLAMAVGSHGTNSKPTLAVIVDNDGKRTLLSRTADGKSKTQKLSADFKSNPSNMTFHDVNQDGFADLVVLIPYEKIKLLLQLRGDGFDEQDISPPGGTVEQPWLSTADVDGDGKLELLLTQKNFLRAVVLKQEASAQSTTNKGGWVFTVKEQINGSANNSRLVGAAAVRNGTNTIPSLFLLDAERKSLTFCERDSSGVWQVVRNILLPLYTDFAGISLEAVQLGQTNSAIALMGRDAIAWQVLAGKMWELTELDGYETPIKDGRLNDIVLGDLNNDGRKDLVFLETARNYLDVVMFDAEQKLVPANRWQVFEERTFRSRRSDLPEPREAFVIDLTGDKKNDLAVVVHDRILVYPQE
jgi:hypothetical protein